MSNLRNDNQIMSKPGLDIEKKSLKSVLTSKSLARKVAQPEKPQQSKDFIKVLREAYERHVRSFRQSVSPLQTLEASFDITSYFIPKKLQTPKITEMQLNRQLINQQNRSLKRVMERFSLRPLPRINQNRRTQDQIENAGFASVIRARDYKNSKTYFPKNKSKRFATEENMPFKHCTNHESPANTKFFSWQKDQGPQFNGWENDSNCSDIEKTAWPS